MEEGRILRGGEANHRGEAVMNKDALGYSCLILVVVVVVYSC
jgi:hypothetical protein